MTVETLTYAVLAERLKISLEAARSLAKRLRLTSISVMLAALLIVAAVAIFVLMPDKVAMAAAAFCLSLVSSGSMAN